MRLTRIGRLVSLIAATAIGIGAAWLARDDIIRLIGWSKAQSELEVEAAKRSLVYRLNREAPLNFAFSRPAGVIRIVSQPLVDAGSWDRLDYWTYGFRVEVYDSGGTAIASHDIHSRALHPDRILPFRRPVRFVRDSDLKIALQDDTVIVSTPAASTIAITPLPSDPAVREIDLRVYERLPFIGRTALAAFHRRSPAEQAQLAGASALPAELLPDAERAALMTNRWKVLGPTGVPGQDYTVTVMYEGRFQPSDEEEDE
ncbi:hypothetical protein [Qipengyuania marisflavi]|uniref:Uncharacterized protein n=1 Tax=Qipengyuania marisflavi TaxID=2486356 RepID=A0A5S3P576_9SPHN|nr:hypothetical protein [Qipengyuania marisflavi]TMM48192.1 hypothetical protein FEV51_07820 [Qipengyuania marisflavi]